MYVAIFVALLVTGEHFAATFPEPFKSEAECVAKNLEVEAMVKAGRVEGVRKYALMCVKVDTLK